MPANFNFFTITSLIATLSGDNKEVQRLTDRKNSVSLLLSDREFVKPATIDSLLKLFQPWNPVKHSGKKQITVAGWNIFLRKRSNSRPSKLSKQPGKKNEENFHGYLLQAIKNAEKNNSPLRIVFQVQGNSVFEVDGVKRAEKVGKKNSKDGLKADELLWLSNGKHVPISLKDDSASRWESADTALKPLADSFWKWAMKNKLIKVVRHESGAMFPSRGKLYPIMKIEGKSGYAFKLSRKYGEPAIFGKDIRPAGAIVVRTFNFSDVDFDDFTNTLTFNCSHVFRNYSDLPESYLPCLLFRNDKSRKPENTCLPAGVRYEIVTSVGRAMGGVELLNFKYD
jgi:hypothetical protein